jgi:pyruvate dehydrogenase E1 component beta subunit
MLVTPLVERKLTIVEALKEAVREEMLRDERVIILGEDVGVPGGIGGPFGVFLGLAEEFGPERVIDTPISEKAIVGAAVGAAAAGLRPLADMQYSDFMFCAMDEIVNQAAKLRYMSGGKLTLPLVIRAPVGATTRGAQHAQSPETYFSHVPGLKVVVPSNAYDAKGLLKTAIRDDNPVLMFEHKLLYGSAGPLKRDVPGGLELSVHVPEEEYLIPLGQAVIRRQGSDVTVVATQLMLYRALLAADELARVEGIQCEIIDPRTLVPFDRETLLTSVSKTGRLVIVHEAHLSYGWGAEVAAIVADEGIYSLKAPVKRVCSYDVPMPFAPILENYVLPDVQRIRDTIRALVAP